MSTTVAFTTLGCRRNQADTQGLHDVEVTLPGPDRWRRRLARVRVTAVEAAPSRGRLEDR